VQGLLGAPVRLLGPGERRHGPHMESSVALYRGCRRRFADRIGVRGLVKRCLLVVEHVPAEVVGSLVVIELGLVGVAAVLREPEFGLALIDAGQRGEVMFVGCGAIGVER